MMPFATGQLLHAFVFDRDCFPKVWLSKWHFYSDPTIHADRRRY